MANALMRRASLTFVFATALALAAASARGHCDTLGGPVVAEARRALEAGDVTPVLKWVKPAGEAEVRAAFARALVVRGLGGEARNLADAYFFETLVRLHRAGEGAPYVGLKPAGEVEPAVALADRALESGSVDALAAALAKQASDGVRQRFERALEARKHADESVAAGREYVEAYVEFTHYAERLHRDATTDAAGDEHAPSPEHQH
jgi:hypothetical protein